MAEAILCRGLSSSYMCVLALRSFYSPSAAAEERFLSAFSSLQVASGQVSSRRDSVQ